MQALQLYRSQLALIDTFILNDNIGAVGTTTEVRTEAVTGGPQHLLALMDVGEGDESWLGPSWSEGKLYFYKDSMGAGFVVYRFDPARDSYASAPRPHLSDGLLGHRRPCLRGDRFRGSKGRQPLF